MHQVTCWYSRKHVDSLLEMRHDTLVGIMVALTKSIEALEYTFQPHRYNVGMNIGKAGGASIEDHLHVHVIPRWVSDTTFMPNTANTKIIAEALDETYDRLHEGFSEVDGVEIDSPDRAIIIK